MKQTYGIWLPANDTHFPRMMNEDGSYQRDIFLAAMEYVKEPKIFYDIGAHVGLWSLMAFRAGFKQIHAYEPNPKTYCCLERNMQAVDSGCYVQLNPHGISQLNQRMKLIEESKENSGGVKAKYISDKQIEEGKDYAFSCSINNNDMHLIIQYGSIKAHEALVKIDTEGTEADCVLGMDKVLYALRPVVCVEQRSNNDALEILQQMGMQIVNQVRKDYILTWKSQ